MPSATQFYPFAYVADLHNGVHNIGSHALKLALSNTAPTTAVTDLASITQIANGGGYTSPGFSLTVASSAQVSGVWRALINDLTFTPTATVANFRYPVLYNSSASNRIICWWEYDAVQTIGLGDTFVFDFDGTLGGLRAYYAP